MDNDSLLASVTDRFPDAALASHTYRGDATLLLRPESLLSVARFLKADAGGEHDTIWFDAGDKTWNMRGQHAPPQ